MSEAAPPLLSVVLVMDAQRERGEAALRSLLAQALGERMEILLLDFAADRPAPAGGDHPSVRRIPMKRGASYGTTLAAGVEAARAPVVAFVEEHVRVLPGWAEAIIEAHRGPWAAVCGEVHPGDITGAVAQRIELVSRHHWSPPAQRGEHAILRWQNVAYKRAALLGFGDRLPLLLQSEATLFRLLRQQGHALYVEPAAKMVHAHEEEWGAFLRGSFLSHWVSAASAVEALAPGVSGRFAQIAAALVGPVRWPLVLLRRCRALPDREVWLPVLLRNGAFVLQYYATVAAGTLGGLVAGTRSSGERFLDYELNEGRQRTEPPA
jgi:hypothetical protein